MVLSINERVDNDGKVKPDLVSKDLSLGRTLTSDAKFEYVKVTLHKESWAAGKSEVNIKRYMSFYDIEQYNDAPHARDYAAEDHPADGDGRRIYQFSRSDINTGKKMHLQCTYVTDWPNQEVNIGNGQTAHATYMYYVVFEYDAWPTAMNDVEIPDAENIGVGIPTHYRSSESYYQIGFIPESAANGWQLNTGGGFWAESWY